MKNASRKKDNRSFLEYSDLKNIFFDNNKINYYSDNVVLGITNYALFQKYSYFHWPAWLTNYNDKGEIVYSPSPPILFNDSLRNGIVFTNYISDEQFFIDPTGMLSPSYASWSVEIWFSTGEELYRPANELDSITLERNSSNGLITANWEKNSLKMQQTIYGTFEQKGEIVVDIDLHLTKKMPDAQLLLVVRPYNYEKIGGLRSISINDSDNTISINGSKCIAVQKPDRVLTGNSKLGDISISDNESTETSCSHGMATMACAYDLTSQKNSINFRISFTDKKNIFAANIDQGTLKKEFTDKSTEVIASGMNVEMNDSLLKNWLYASKAASLNITDKKICLADKSIDAKTFYFMVSAYNRMGYYNESTRMIELVKKNLGALDKNNPFDYIINISYLVIAVEDYYVHSRDFEYLQKQYDNLRNYVTGFLKILTKIKKINYFDTNSLKELYIPESHPYDFILIASALNKLAYLARCMGIFGDEKKYIKESDRFEEMYVKSIFEKSDHKIKMSEFYYYNVYCGFPFHLNAATSKNVRTILNTIQKSNKNYLIYNRSMGLDILSTFVVANNLLHLKRPKAIEVVENLLKRGKKRYVLPQYVNPITGNGCWGEGDSSIVSAVTYMTLRNMLFIDNTDRLDLFPVPKPAWFKVGKELVISNAPSRFGYLDIKVVTTSTEVLVHFNSLPKYVPPDIMINLPFKVTILKGDDYIIKKEEDKSFVINGWPSVVRFRKK